MKTIKFQTVLILYLFFSITPAKAQNVLISSFGDSVLLYRISEKDHLKIKKKNIELFYKITMLEGELNRYKNSVLNNKSVYPQGIVAYITYVKDISPTYNLNQYNNEISFYYDYSNLFKMNSKRVKDSSELAQVADFEQRRLREKLSFDSAYKIRKFNDSLDWANKKKIDEERSRKYDSTTQANYRIEKANYTVECIKKFGKKYGAIIANDDVVTGMNKEMVEEAWSTPQRINQTVTSSGKTETWMYRNNKWVIFKNGIVISVTK